MPAAAKKPDSISPVATNESLTTLVGQAPALQVLRKGLAAETLAGAYLFVGAPGVGKGALARAFAKAAACLDLQLDPVDACGTCASCRLASTGNHPEIVSVFPSGEHLQIWQFWDRDNKPQGLLSHTLSFAPAVGRRRVYIIEQAETLTESAANSLLKVLEEPPPYVLFVLLATHPARMLPTIVSRSQVLRLQPLPTDELAAYLYSDLEVPADRAAMLAAYCEGRIGQAVHLASHPLVAEEIERVLDFADSLPEAPRVRALRAAEQIRKLATQVKALIGEEPAEAEEGEAGATGKERAGRRQLAVVFDLLVAFYRDLLTLRVCGAEGRIINRQRSARMLRLAQTGSVDRWSTCLDALLLARRRLDANANVTLVTEVLAFTLLDR